MSAFINQYGKYKLHAYRAPTTKNTAVKYTTLSLLC